MVRHVVLALVAFLLLLGGAAAADIKGTIEKINTKSGDLVLKVGDKTQTFMVTYKAKVLDPDGKEQSGKKRLAIFKVGSEVTITTEKQKVGEEEKEVVTQLKLNK